MGRRMRRGLVVGLLAWAAAMGPGPGSARGDVTREEVEEAIRLGVGFLKKQQRRDGNWPGKTGTTALATLALLTAGEPADDPQVAAGLRAVAAVPADALNDTYAVALQAMALQAAGGGGRFKVAIAAAASYLERSQISGKMGPRGTMGAWTYNINHAPFGDNSNTQYALLGLQAAREAGIPIRPRVWELAREHWQSTQHRDGGWAYQGQGAGPSTASMTTAGISSLVITNVNLVQDAEQLVGEEVRHCGRHVVDPGLQRAFDWMAANFHVDQNAGAGQSWVHYYLYGLERAGRLTGQRYFGGNDWYRLGAEQLVREQLKAVGSWGGEGGPIVETCFALLFLSKGRAPVLINKLRHGPEGDWNNDRDDARNLVASVSRDWGHLLTWQTVDPATATVEDLLQAPIAYFNGHEGPLFNVEARDRLRQYAEQGGLILAEACCGREEFDRGFRALMERVFPEPEYALHPLPAEHAVYRSRYPLGPDVHPLWGIEHGCRTVVIYSPGDLSCFWNHAETESQKAAVIKATRVGHNIVDYATGREMPADKLVVRHVAKLGLEAPRRGALQIAKLRHAGDWNIAPLAIPHLTSFLHDGPRRFDVVVNHREITPRDPNLRNYPLVYIHGRGALSLAKEDQEALVRHLQPGGGTLFADAACGSPAFDRAFRALLAEMLPKNPLVPIPPDDPIFSDKVAYDLHQVEFSKAAELPPGPPRLEGIQLDGHWAVIYSPFDIGCALESHSGADCKGYTHESALKIASNLVIYATLP